MATLDEIRSEAVTLLAATQEYLGVGKAKDIDDLLARLRDEATPFRPFEGKSETVRRLVHLNVAATLLCDGRTDGADEFGIDLALFDQVSASAVAALDRCRAVVSFPEVRSALAGSWNPDAISSGISALNRAMADYDPADEPAPAGPR